MNWSKLIYTKPDAEKLEKSISVIRIFSIFGIVNFLIFYVLWNLINDQENSSEFLRITSLILLCILYILSFFYKRIPYILTLLWYFTVMYCLPFFGTYMLMKNINSISWLTNIILGIFWLTLIIDWAAFIIILPLGILLGILAYRIVDRPINIDLSVLDDVVSNYLWSIVIAVIFSRKKELVEKENQVKKFTILNKSLEKALLAKTEFLNNMSHEVRTPIQGVVNISEGLVDMWDKYKEDERLFFAKKVAEYSRRLISLVSNLLDLSKFNVGKMTFTMDEADLVTLINDMVKECRDLYVGSKDIDIIFESELGRAPLVCDHDKITQVLRNLFANAIKFTKSGRVEARLERIKTENNADKAEEINEHYRFTLTDDGVGIPIGEEEEIFEAFIQSTRTKTKAGGTGLGLAICRSIIKAHKGSIRAYNKNDNGYDKSNTLVGHNKNSDQDIIDKRNSISGSVFEVILPLQPTDDNNDDNNNNNSKENKEEQNKAIDRNLDYIENDENSCVENKREDKNEISSDNKTILMIDDEEAAHMAMDIMLSGTDYKLISAYGGIEGLEMIRSYRREIDLVLLDLMMPDMDGVAVLSSVRGDEEISNIKVILQTGSSDTQMIEKAKSYNIIDIINKPYDRAKILDMLSKYFK